MNNLEYYLGILWPVIIINILLIVIALKDLIKNGKYRFGNRLFWVLIILFIQIIGPIFYLTLGRDD